MRIKHNISSLNSLRHAGNTMDRVKDSLQKLSSGLSINSGADSPANLIASERMRGRIIGLQQAHENASLSVSIVQTAEGALNEISSILLRLKQLTVHAANEATNDKQMLAADQQEIEHLLSSLDRIAKNTVWGTKNLLDGSMGVNGTTVGENLRFISAEVYTNMSPEDGFEIDITQVATRAEKKGSIAIDVDNMGEGLVLFLNEGGKNATIDTRYGDFKVEIEKIRKNAIENPQRFPPEDMSRDIRTIVVNRLQSAIDEAGLALHTFMDPNGLLTVRHNDFGDKAIFSVTSSIAGIGSEEANVAAFSRAGKNVEGTIAGQIAMGDGQFLTAIDGTKASGVTVAYEREIGLKEVPVLDQRGVQVGTEFIEETNEEVVGSGPEGYVHVAQFSNEFQLGPNSGQSERLSLKNVKANMLGQGIENSSGFQSLTDIDVTTSQGAQDSNKVVDSAIDQISTLRADLGAFQKNALESNLNSLRIAEENLTSAESTIRDADVAQQMSQLTGDQIMLSANTAMIAQANQVPRTVLGLIENSSF